MNEREHMLTSVLNCRRLDLYTDDLRLSPEQEREFSRMMSRRQDGVPLQYILGEVEFCGLVFEVNRDVLIPRPETELMADHLVGELQKRSGRPVCVLEIGTGSGCIAVSLAKQISDLSVHAVDISADALAVARRNAQRHHVDERIVFEQRDGLGFWDEIVGGRYDVIVANPPYIPTGDLKTLPPDVRREPVLALDGGPDGLEFYRHFFQEAPGVLRPEGLLVCEFADGQGEAIRRMAGASWPMTWYRDFSGTDRFFVAQYCPS